VKIPNLEEKDHIIAVLGATGTGKSTFIECATGSPEHTKIGHALESQTQELVAIRCAHPTQADSNVVFVDTPGFDDTYRTDTEVLQQIAHWLTKSYKTKKLLSGIIFLHRISDNRMAGTPLRNLQMFGKLCGDKALPNVVLATTMWNRPKADEAGDQRRENDLRATYWQPMLTHGSMMERFNGSYGSAWSIVDIILRADITTTVLLQEEMVDLQKHLSQTEAGRALYAHLHQAFSRHQTTVLRLSQDAKRQDDAALADELKEEYRRAEADLHAIGDQLDAMKVPIGKRIQAIFSRWRKPQARSVNIPGPGLTQ